VRFTEGRGVPVNLEEAARWFERAANQGLVPAIYRLGSIYEKGQGVRKNLDGARRLYVAAAERGNAKAMHNIAVLHAEGADGKPDYRAAAQWFGKAAAHGVADSQYNLGILYARGIGVDQNLAESYKWFSLAAAQGDQDAGKKREDVAARLDKQALVAAKLAVQTWTADTPPADAMTVAAPAGGWDKADAQATKPKPTSTVRPKAKAS
jgi:localization factor PodJL